MILIKPVISEKSIAAIEANKYLFKVAKSANKQEIKKDIEANYKVNVTKVNVLVVKSEEKLIRGRFPSKIKGWKKAIVTIKKGQKIADFEIKESK